MNNKLLSWLRNKFGSSEEEDKLLLIPSSQYPESELWKLDTSSEMYLRKLDSYYFYKIVEATHSFAKGKESKETLIILTAKHALIKQLLEN